MKKLKNAAGLILAAAGLLLLISSCGQEQTITSANELVFAIDGIEEVAIMYDEENMFFYASETDELIVREYMTLGRRRYYATVRQEDGKINISEGWKPILDIGFERYVEVYVPKSYAGALVILNTSGDIALSSLENFKLLRVESTSGRIAYDALAGENIYMATTSGEIAGDALRADTIAIATTSGEVACRYLEGAMFYSTTSGNLAVASAAGHGAYHASNSGILDVAYAEVTGDLTLSNKNDDVNLILPAELEFYFEAQSKNGVVTANFEEYLAEEAGVVSGAVGATPECSIKITTHDGDIHVRR